MNRIACAYHSRYNGWTVLSEENGISEEVAMQAADKLPMITIDLCDADGEYDDDEFPDDIFAQIEEAVRSVIPECEGVDIEFDPYSS